jgi:sulfur carrier protein
MIHVNGDPLQWQPGMTVRDVLRARNYKFPLLIVSVGETIIPRAEYDTTTVPDGADVRVVHLTSGG